MKYLVIILPTAAAFIIIIIVIVMLTVCRLNQVRGGKMTKPPPAAAEPQNVGQSRQVVQSFGMNNGCSSHFYPRTVGIQPTTLGQMNQLAQCRSSVAENPIRNMIFRGQWTPNPWTNNVVTAASTPYYWPYGQKPPIAHI